MSYLVSGSGLTYTSPNPTRIRQDPIRAIHMVLLVKLWDGDRRFLIPSLLPRRAVDDEVLGMLARARASRVRFEFADVKHLPSGFFERVQAYLIRKIHRMRGAKESQRSKGRAMLKIGIYRCCVEYDESRGQISASVLDDAPRSHSVYVSVLEIVSSAVCAVSRDFFHGRLAPSATIFQAGPAEDPREDLPLEAARAAAAFQHWFPREVNGQDVGRQGGGGPTPTQPPQRAVVGARGAERKHRAKISDADGVDPIVQLHKEITARRKRICIVAAVDDYSKTEMGDLTCATNDGNLIAETMGALGWEVHATLFNKKCTKTNVLAAFDEVFDIFGDVDPQIAQFLFFFAGHGSVKTRNNGHDEGLLWMSDSDQSKRNTMLWMRELRDKACCLPVQQVMIVLDACFTGQIFPRMNMGFDSVRDADQFRKWIKKDDGSVASVVAMTACGDNEYALESRASASANGFFTAAFVEALRHAPVDAMVRPRVRTDAAAHGFVLGHKLFDGGAFGDSSIVD